jgi:peroxiredoxin
MTETLVKAPELQVTQWFNTEKALSLSKLAGKVVVIESFQMLCPGCVSHGLPLAQSIYDTFPKDKVAVIGLHTVFEHHAAMTPVSLEAFLFEYRLTFPVGVDEPDKSAIPKTMQAYSMQGTPSLILIDTRGHVRANYFGQISELRIGAEIATLVAEGNSFEMTAKSDDTTGPECDSYGCPV